MTTEGDATALPRLGLFQWENTIPAPNQSDTTLVMGQEDGPAGNASELWVYVGTKQRNGRRREGRPDERRQPRDRRRRPGGLDRHRLARDLRQGYPAVTIVDNDWNQTGAAQNADALADGLSLNRIEDGYWDPNNPNDFYFVTTEGGQNNGENPSGRSIATAAASGACAGTTSRIRTRVRRDAPPRRQRGARCGRGRRCNKPDNMAIDSHGNLLIQEDPGNVNHLARIVAYRIGDGALGVVARFDEPCSATGATADPTADDRRGVERDHRRRGVPRRRDVPFDAQIHTRRACLPERVRARSRSTSSAASC